MEEILKDLQNRFDLTEVIKKDEVRTIITAKKEDIRPLLLHLKTFSGFTHLVLISAVDYIEDNKFQLTYILHNYDLKKYILLRVFIDRENPIMESIHPLWIAYRTSLKPTLSGQVYYQLF
jgi:NADH-quinone oxidoreductase subunit C